MRRTLIAVLSAAIGGAAIVFALSVNGMEAPSRAAGLAAGLVLFFAAAVLALRGVIRPLQERLHQVETTDGTRIASLERELATATDELAQAEEFAGFQRRIDDCDREDELFAAVRRELESLDLHAEMLVTSPTRDVLSVVASSAEQRLCPVASGSNCPAIRLQTRQDFLTSESIHSCSQLRNRRGGPCGGVCVPLRVLGLSEGVLHIVTPEHDLPTESFRRAIDSAVTSVGNRLGVVRATAAMAEQATTDPLTGLVNRRTLETEVRRLHGMRMPYTLLVADLDHFKRLNDTFGHETGDAALTAFARVIEQTIRGGDIPCRFGGEEFVVLFPDCSVEAAAPVVHRIRDALQGAIARQSLPTFTASYGLADSTFGVDFEHVFRFADHALFQAKDQGRDRLIIADPLDPPRALATFLPPTEFDLVVERDDER